MSNRKPDARDVDRASVKGGGSPPPGDDGSDMDGLFVDDLPRPAPRPRRKSKSTKEKRRSGRASERRRERGDAPAPVDGAQTKPALKRSEERNGASGAKKSNGAPLNGGRSSSSKAASPEGPSHGASSRSASSRSASSRGASSRGARVESVDLSPMSPTEPHQSQGFTGSGASGKLAFAVGALTCIKGPEEGLVLKLLEGDYMIGRARENNFVLKDIAASREHLKIRVLSGRAIAVDMGSGNGTKVNGAKIAEKELIEGDRIELGNSVLVFSKLSGDQSMSMPQAPKIAPAPRAETQERIVMAAERLAAELSERFRREEDGLDDLPDTSYERKRQQSQPPPLRPSVSVVDDSDLAAEINAMVKQVSSPEVRAANVEDMWGDSETETRMPSEPVPPAVANSISMEPIRPALPRGQARPPVMVPVSESSSYPEMSISDIEPSASAPFPSRAPVVDGPSYVHKTRNVAAKARSPFLAAVLVSFGVVIVVGALLLAYFSFDEQLAALMSDESPQPAGEVSATTATGETVEGKVGAASASSTTAESATDDKKPNEKRPTSDDAKKDASSTKRADAQAVDNNKDDKNNKKAENTRTEKASVDNKASGATAAPKDTKSASKDSAKDAPKDAPKEAKAEPKERVQPKPERRETRAEKAKPARRDPPPRESPKERDPPPKAAAKGMDDDQAKALVGKAVGALRNDDFDEACPILARVAKDASAGSTWKLKAENLTRMRCQ